MQVGRRSLPFDLLTLHERVLLYSSMTRFPHRRSPHTVPPPTSSALLTVKLGSLKNWFPTLHRFSILCLGICTQWEGEGGISGEVERVRGGRH